MKTQLATLLGLIIHFRH